ncbi:hypothetical protein [Natrialbaceae archaeon AArc-T1-2]|uniref:PaaD-like zinc ribbon domain-containing protein n=1 Tax=Natrialbaceae archaeon AArc-T1-2 TaxID=3053904 RepID=UPI00255AE2C6|nr:hypothetical protein [Natrialbaceae archaeon AArc-T1-2]WIV68870.1 hypothetical protein QQ977_16365 [Natrialbaceae archaeon AArc-T1-2]
MTSETDIFARNLDEIECPFCGCPDTELTAPFGASLSDETFRCRGCNSVFNWLKWDGDRPED